MDTFCINHLLINIVVAEFALSFEGDHDERTKYEIMKRLVPHSIKGCFNLSQKFFYKIWRR